MSALVSPSTRRSKPAIVVGQVRHESVEPGIGQGPVDQAIALAEVASMTSEARISSRARPRRTSAGSRGDRSRSGRAYVLA
jgi:hypothetical protein